MAFPKFEAQIPKPQFGGINEAKKLVTKKREDLKKLLLENAESSASTVKTLATTSMTTLKNTISGLMPALPDVPTTSLQGEMSSLMSLNLSNPTAYVSKLSSLKSSFGTALSGKGKDLTSMLSDIQSSIDVSSFSSFDQAGLTKNLVKNVPNFEILGGSTKVFEKATKTLTAQLNAVKEDLSEISEDTINQSKGNDTIIADATVILDKSKDEFAKQIAKIEIKRSANGTIYTDDIKSKLEVIDGETLITLLEDDNFDTHPAIAKEKFENVRQKTLSTDTFVAKIKKEQNIDISKEQIDFQVRFNEPFYKFLGIIDKGYTRLKGYEKYADIVEYGTGRPKRLHRMITSDVENHKYTLRLRVKWAKEEKQATEEEYKKEGEWTEKIISNWEKKIGVSIKGVEAQYADLIKIFRGDDEYSAPEYALEAQLELEASRQ